MASHNFLRTYLEDLKRPSYKVTLVFFPRSYLNYYAFTWGLYIKQSAQFKLAVPPDLVELRSSSIARYGVVANLNISGSSAQLNWASYFSTVPYT